MNTTFDKTVTWVLIAGAASFGCGSPPKDTSGSTTSPPMALVNSDDPISIPQNAGAPLVEQAEPLTLLMNITSTASGSVDLPEGTKQALKVYMESELPRLKRFEMYALFNDGAIRLGQELGDIGDAEYVEQDQMKFDLVLNLSMDVQTETSVARGVKNRKVKAADDKLDSIRYTIVTSASLAKHKSAKIQASKNFQASETRKFLEMINPLTGKREFTGAFNPKDPDNINTLLQQVARPQLVDIALWLGSYYPITGSVTGLSATATRMGLNKGFEQGLRNEIEMVVWCEDDIGIATAIAAVTVEARATKATLNIARWSKEPDAIAIIEVLKANPQSAKNSDLKATTFAMPIPIEWKKMN